MLFLAPLIVAIILWDLRHMTLAHLDIPYSWFELSALILAYAAAGKVASVMQEHLDWALRPKVFLSGTISAVTAAVVALFLLFLRSISPSPVFREDFAVTWHELGVVAAFFIHGALIVLTLNCSLGGCEEN